MRGNGFGIIAIFALITYAALCLVWLKAKLDSRLSPVIIWILIVIVLVGLIATYIGSLEWFSSNRKWDSRMPWVGSSMALLSWLAIHKIKSYVDQW